MSTGTVTTTADKITPKDPNGLRIIFSQTGGNEVSLALSGIQDWDYVTKEMLVNFVTPGLPVVSASIAVGASDIYTLTSGELADINTYGRYPNFVAVCSGTPFSDIQPTYVGSLGGFTAVTVNLHSDGSGHNVDATDLQFS